MILKQGNLFDSDAPAIGHGVNCQGVMGAGIAKQFAERFPGMVERYRSACDTGELVVGRVQTIPVMHNDRMTWVYNFASQHNPGADATEAWLTSALMMGAHRAEWQNIKRIAIPEIGCGIGGLTKDALYRAVGMAEQYAPVTFEVWEFTP